MFVVHVKAAHANAQMFGPFADYLAAEDFLCSLPCAAWLSDALGDGSCENTYFKYIEQLRPPALYDAHVVARDWFEAFGAVPPIDD